MPKMEPRPSRPVVSPGQNAAERSRLAGSLTEFIVQGPETWVPVEAAAVGDPDSIAAWAFRKGAPAPEPIPREAED